MVEFFIISQTNPTKLKTTTCATNVMTFTFNVFNISSTFWTLFSVFRMFTFKPMPFLMAIPTELKLAIFAF